MNQIVLVADGPIQVQRNGGSIRRDGLCEGLKAHGVSVRVQHVESDQPDANFARRYRSAPWSALLESTGDASAIIVEGLPLFPLVRRLSAQGVPVVWDLCDSWALKYASMARTFPHFPHLARAAVAAGVLRRGSAAGAWRTYVTERDRTWDEHLVRSSHRSSVVGNGVNVRSRPATAGEGCTAILADWRYPPNRQGLAWLDRLLSTQTVQEQVHLYGPAAATVPAYPWANRVGYVDSVDDVYAGARLVLAPVISGAGLKNKVIEAACAGVPVITTIEGVSGLDGLPPWVAVEPTGDGFVARWRSWADSPPTVPREELARLRARYSWQRATLPLFELLQSRGVAR